MKVRIRFTKQGAVRYVGHLDFMRYFQKAIRRADIRPAYTRGFHPHLIMTFACPLGVGTESTGDYFDVELLWRDPYPLTRMEKERLADLGIENEALPVPPSAEELIEKLNGAMAEGVTITGMWRVSEADGSAMALVSAADYQVKLHEELFPDLDFAASFAAFMAQETIPFTKETKKGTTELDLKPMIMDWRVDGPNGRELFLHVTQGSKNNLKPETVLAAFAAFAGQEFDPYGFSVCRSELYMEDGRTLAEAGQSI